MDIFYAPDYKGKLLFTNKLLFKSCLCTYVCIQEEIMGKAIAILQSVLSVIPHTGNLLLGR